MSLLVDGPGFVVWRHPRAWGAAGRCIGRTDLRCDPRKVRRLARCIRRHAMRQGLPRCVVTSPLRRCRAVGCHLRRWGWRHIVDEALLEANFGSWDGLQQTVDFADPLGDLESIGGAATDGLGDGLGLDPALPADPAAPAAADPAAPAEPAGSGG